jgi:hypothetical protein
MRVVVVVRAQEYYQSSEQANEGDEYYERIHDKEL